VPTILLGCTIDGGHATGAFAPAGFAHPTNYEPYRTTPEMNPGLRRGGLMSFFR
jgi:hypothetical protein